MNYDKHIITLEDPIEYYHKLAEDVAYIDHYRLGIFNPSGIGIHQYLTVGDINPQVNDVIYDNVACGYGDTPRQLYASGVTSQMAFLRACGYGDTPRQESDGESEDVVLILRACGYGDTPRQSFRSSSAGVWLWRHTQADPK